MSVSIAKDIMKSEWAGKGSDLLNKKMMGIISQADFKKECMYMILHCEFDSIHPFPLPTPPTAMDKFRELGDDERKEIKQSFWMQKEMIIYRQHIIRIARHNIHQKQWLRECMENFLGYGDTESAKKIRDKLADFDTWEYENEYVIKKIKKGERFQYI